MGPSGLPGTLPKAAAGQKVYRGAGTGGSSEARRCRPESVQGLILLLFPHEACSQSPFSLSIWSWTGGHSKWSHPESPTAPFPARWLSSCQHSQRRADEGCERQPRSSLWPAETLQQLNPELICVHVLPPLGVHRWGPWKPRKLVHILCIGEFFWGAESYSFYHSLQGVREPEL